jgi:hypothetical protein
MGAAILLLFFQNLENNTIHYVTVLTFEFCTPRMDPTPAAATSPEGQTEQPVVVVCVGMAGKLIAVCHRRLPNR